MESNPSFPNPMKIWCDAVSIMEKEFNSRATEILMVAESVRSMPRSASGVSLRRPQDPGDSFGEWGRTEVEYSLARNRRTSELSPLVGCAPRP